MWVPGIRNVTKLVCGTNHVLALDTNDKVWAWGNGQQNQLGRRLTERKLEESLVPTHVGFIDKEVKRPSKHMVDISCGAYHAFAVGADGHVWSWGVNNYGETGIPEGAGTDNATIARPTVVQALEGLTINSIKGGTHHNLAVTGAGQVLAWGRCDNAALGLARENMKEEDVLKDDNGKWKILLHPAIVPGKSFVYSPTLSTPFTNSTSRSQRHCRGQLWPRSQHRRHKERQGLLLGLLSHISNRSGH